MLGKVHVELFVQIGALQARSALLVERDSPSTGNGAVVVNRGIEKDVVLVRHAKVQATGQRAHAWRHLPCHNVLHSRLQEDPRCLDG